MKEETFLTLFLSAVLLLYMLLGGFLFQFLESENEAKSIERYVELFTRLQTKNNISMDLMYQIVQTHEQACEIGQESQENRKWDFVGSFYFSGTVITTIGFGHASPSTFFGQLALIVFALTSIPLYVLFMNVLLERIITLLKNFLNKLYMILPTNDFIKRHDVHTLPISRILTMDFISLSWPSRQSVSAILYHQNSNQNIISIQYIK
ncbi:potassium channel subfamily K member 13-like [Hydractinia symbiolongicarpus]|uniref:potassium channel subfamily K member 13-like n=1 Tax=Hydractinia symbiolongicarpus TaxID=13093 RepID=UPI002549D06A|nr:potassium channel subfamily K member 13-like [Hydractinia symbiolongicarpus]